MDISEELEDRFKKFVAEAVGDENPENFLRKLRQWLEVLRDKEFRASVNYHKALGNEIRLGIFRLVSHQPLCTCGLAAVLGLPESNVTHHIKILEDAGLVYGKKQGRFTVYWPLEKIFKGTRNKFAEAIELHKEVVKE